ncbi:MAG: hypothetical protein AB1798_23525, partial [Spirochaetota bacterium]
MGQIRKPLIAAMIMLCTSLGLYAEPFSIGELVKAVVKNSPDYKKNEALLNRYRFDDLVSRASLKPALSVNLPLTFNDALKQKLQSGVELNNEYLLSV